MENDEYDTEESVEETQEEEVEAEVDTEAETEEKEQEEEQEEEIDWKERALKAEQTIEKAKKKGKSEKPAKVSAELSPVDYLALAKADVTEEDLAEVMDFAKYRKLSVAEALKSPTLKAILKEQNELRASAQATSPTAKRRAPATTSEEKLLADARSGNLPDSEEDIARLVALRHK